MTAVAIFWSRVDLQTLRFFPWASLQRGEHNGKEMLALDYTSMVLPKVLITAFKSQHYFVFLVTLVSVILKVQIVLSSGLFYIETIPIEKMVDVQVLDSFHTAADGQSKVSTPKTTSYYNAQAVRDFGFSYPFGVTKEAAYQTFQHGNNISSSRGTKESPLTAVVDGFFTEVDCLLLQNYTVAGITAPGGSMGNETYPSPIFDLKFEDCERTIRIEPSFFGAHNGPSWVMGTPPGDPRPCASLPQQHDQFLHFTAILRTPIIAAAAAVLCAPRSWVSKVQITDDGISPNLTVLENQTAELAGVNIWNLLEKSISREGSWLNSTSGVMGPLEADYYFNGNGFSDWNATDSSYYENKNLLQAVTNLTEALGPLLAHYHIRESNKTQMSGQTLERTPRLLVNQGVCIAMAVLFGIAMAISGWVVYTTKQIYGGWRRDPTTILGSIIFFSKVSKTAQAFSANGGFIHDEQDCRKMWSQSQHSPLALRTWLRTLFTIYTLGLIISLAVTLQISQRPATSGGPSGLVTVNEGALTIWWTSLPALAMLLVTLYTTSSDLAMRDLAMLSRLATRSCSANDIDISLLDMLGLRALYHSLRLRIFSVTLSQILAIVCGTLTALSSMLFHSEIVPEITSTSLKQQSWLGHRPSDSSIATPSSTELSSLLVMHHNSSFTWPQGTYADLVFPKLGFPDGGDTSLEFRASVQSEAPAARLKPSCIRHTKTEYYTRTRVWKTVGSKKYYAWEMFRNITCPGGTIGSTMLTGVLLDAKDPGLDYEYFASTSTSFYTACDVNTEIYKDSYSTSYIWGNFSALTATANYVAYWTCNYTWSEVPTNLNLEWQNGALRIDPSKPPVPDNSRIRQLYTPFPMQSFNDPAPDAKLDDKRAARVGPNYNYIFKPLGPLDLDSLGDPDQEQAVMAEMNEFRGIMEAQKANIKNRLGLEEASASEPFQPGTLPSIDGIITDDKKHRLVQNPGITFAIIAILSMAFATNTASLISRSLRYLAWRHPRFLPDLDQKGLVVNGFNSISMLESLLSRSNALWLIPENAEQLPSNELYQNLSGISFRLGWFYRKDTRREEFTVGTQGDENFAFLGSK
ncbi:unnamed protein product [Clonostachys solani]|uniref:Uncharacterized protein n=1 Tax=Clonostachys solani TaxID=160281 RepID=A0A9P0EM00_9HYPO|nr:unnamed protein product [Clonostachys solani]